MLGSGWSPTLVSSNPPTLGSSSLQQIHISGQRWHPTFDKNSRQTLGQKLVANVGQLWNANVGQRCEFVSNCSLPTLAPNI